MPTVCQGPGLSAGTNISATIATVLWDHPLCLLQSARDPQSPLQGAWGQAGTVPSRQSSLLEAVWATRAISWFPLVPDGFYHLGRTRVSWFGDSGMSFVAERCFMCYVTFLILDFLVVVMTVLSFLCVKIK